jgi:hypothetical protein
MNYLPTIQELLSTRRGYQTAGHKKFCKKYLEPVFGKPDEHGNYMLTVGDNPSVCFTAHSDTCHFFDPKIKQEIIVDGDFLRLHPDEDARCLGADDAAGIYIILHMIAEGINGRYCIFNGEEEGGIGSFEVVKSEPEWVQKTDLMVSFDRAGYNSVITAQAGGICCNEIVAWAIADAVNESPVAVMDYSPDNTGTFTDSANFTAFIPNVTNLSVGYDLQHSSDEFQDNKFLHDLLRTIVLVDWDKLGWISRDNPIANYTTTF